MFKSLYSKLVLSHTAVIIFTLAVLTAAAAVMAEDYYRAGKEKELLEKAQEAAAVIEEEIKGEGEGYSLAVSYMNRFFGERTIFFDREELEKIRDQEGSGQTDLPTGGGRGQRGYGMGPGPVHLFVLDGDDAEALLKNKRVSGERAPRGGDDAAPPFVYAAVPVSADGKIAGALVMSAPLKDIREAVSAVIRLMLFAALPALAVSMFFGWFLSRRISGPLKAISDAAVKIASGNYSMRLDIKGDDEIGKLAENFNVMADSLKKNINELVRTDRMRRDLLSNVSHELRTPLTSLQGYVEAILDGAVKPHEVEKYLRVIHKETLRLKRLVGNILDLAVIESGKDSWEINEIDIEELFERTAAEMQPAAEKAGVDIEISVPENLPGALGNEDRIEQVLLNLLSNAVSHSSQGGKVFIKAEKKGDEVVVSVKDQGPGIPEEELPFIWERFYRIDKSRARSEDYEGTGLGLAIVKEIVERHGGRVWAESRPGEGAEFFFTLKAADESNLDN